MKKNVRTIVFLVILVVFAVLYFSLLKEQADKTLSQETEVLQTGASLQKPEIKDSQPASDEKVTFPSSQQSVSETLRQEAEQRFEKLTKIEEASGKPDERREGLRVQIEIPTPSESE